MSHRTKILSLLRERGNQGVTNKELNHDLGIFRYGARIMELRQEGHNIQSIHVHRGLWKFILKDRVSMERAEERRPLAAFDPLHGGWVNL